MHRTANEGAVQSYRFSQRTKFYATLQNIDCFAYGVHSRARYHCENSGLSKEIPRRILQSFEILDFCQQPGSDQSYLCLYRDLNTAAYPFAVFLALLGTHNRWVSCLPLRERSCNKYSLDKLLTYPYLSCAAPTNDEAIFREPSELHLTMYAALVA